MECKTYRWRAHFEIESIPDLRPKDEIEAWKKKCPIARLERKMLEEGILIGQEIDEINAQVMSRIEDAVGYALESPFPAPEAALEDIFST